MRKFEIGKTYTERDGMFRTKWAVIDRRETVSSTGRNIVTLRLENSRGDKISSRVAVKNGVEVCQGGYYGFIAVALLEAMR